MNNIVFFAKPVVTESKSIAIQFGLNSPDQVHGHVHVEMLDSGAKLDIPFTAEPGNQQLELNTYFEPKGNLANPETSIGRVEIWTSDSFPYIISFTCRSVGFACEITSEHIQSTPLTL